MNSKSTVERSEEMNESAASQKTQKPRPQPSSKAQLARLWGMQGLLAIVTLSLFAAADSWQAITGLALASSLSVVTGIIAGITLATLIHEWFHLLGAYASRGDYDIAKHSGLFLFNWNFSNNSVSQFFVMSIAGSVGGALAVLLLWHGIPSNSWGRVALQSAAIASFINASLIEWPVLYRTRLSQQPLAELSKVDKGVVLRCFIAALSAGLLIMIYLAP